MRISRKVLSCHVVAEVVGFDDEEESSSSRRGEYQQCNAKSFGSVSSATPKCLLGCKVTRLVILGKGTCLGRYAVTFFPRLTWQQLYLSEQFVRSRQTLRGAPFHK